MTENLYPVFQVLIVDDEPAWLDSMSLSLERIAGITNIMTCSDSREVEEILSQGETGLVILDLTMPFVSGQTLLEFISENYPMIKVVVITGLNQLETAVECMKLGAYDYFVKTEGERRLSMGIFSAIQMVELQMENAEISSRLMEDKLVNPSAFSGIQSVSRQMRSIFQYIESVARTSQPILITGESGVGKEVAAQVIHHIGDKDAEMISVNVAGLDDHMFSDTLFGHIKGAYTGSTGPRSGLMGKANGSTLFLDEIGDLNLNSQVKLLRVLNNGEYFPLGSDTPHFSNAKIVVATNQDLDEKIRQGLFRKDLYYRLQTHHVHIPPLRERQEDIPLLLNHFIEEAAEDMKRDVPGISPDVIDYLQDYSFPGNIRELRSMVYDAVAKCCGSLLNVKSFKNGHDFKETAEKENSPLTADTTYENLFRRVSKLPTINDAVKMLLREALRRTDNNQSSAAKILGLSQSALNKRLKKISNIE